MKFLGGMKSSYHLAVQITESTQAGELTNGSKLMTLLVPLVSTFQYEGDHERYRLTVAKERPRLHEKTQGQTLQ
ncbi:hypothetical protein RchiOBHm_Chr5g0064241 [Rosa chinensis]|uniref:Uncharacterized protein n=1 Tax=Rosa chinensis TaxID=74649 RepID=A0A2P6QIM8_ROSCH|nr:hypothetical protein RchiOBHm_Chr5g0064241 [Rosa chinensis]